MKCPRCKKSSIITERRPNGDSICNSCRYRGKTTEFNTTAEKLLWLTNVIKGFSIFECDFGEVGIRLDLPNDKKMFFTTNDTLLTSNEKLINAAYEWAKANL